MKCHSTTFVVVHNTVSVCTSYELHETVYIHDDGKIAEQIEKEELGSGGR